MTHSQEIKPAASSVVVRDKAGCSQVLLLRKNQKLKFAADFWVFPGGKVDSADFEQDPDLDSANRVAAIRECHEETNLQIEHTGLVPISHWTTPKMQPRRYATQFFFTEIDRQQNVVVDQDEIVDHHWLTASEALDLYNRRKIKLMPPTIVTLTELARYQQSAEMRQFYQQRGNRTYKPVAVFKEKPSAVQHGFPDGVLLYEGDSGYEERIAEIGDRLNRCTVESGIISHQCNLDV